MLDSVSQLMWIDICDQSSIGPVESEITVGIISFAFVNVKTCKMKTAFLNSYSLILNLLS